MARAAQFFLTISLGWLITASLAEDSFTKLVNQFTHNASLTSAGQKFLQNAQEYENAEFPDTTPEENAEYDIIVVGAGSAGSILASRLSEIPDVTVILFEGGSNETLLMDIPLIATATQLSSNNWNYTTDPSENYCLGMINNQCRWARGKVMGGSATINGMVMNRGHPSNYDDWADLGNTGWSYEDVLPYFKKMESVAIPEFQEDEDQRGTEGPMNIEYPPYHTDLSASCVDAAEKIGYRTDYDYNGETQNGFSLSQTNTASGRRLTSNTAYLHPIRDRSNLFVSKNSLVRKVLINKDGNRAYGVEIIKGNKIITVIARKEVILSAGAIGSPQLLMLSGIGPKDHLIEKDITVIQDAPVGENLMDHVSFTGLLFLTNQTVSVPTSDALNPASSYFAEYVENNGDGPLSNPNYGEAVGFMNVDDRFDTEGPPNLEIIFLSTSSARSSEAKEAYGYTDSTWSKTFQSIAGQNSWSALPIMLSPLSRGKILLENNDIYTHPKIIPNYFSNDEDLRVIVAGIKYVIELSETDSLRKYGSELYKAPIAGCEDYEYGSDSYWMCAVRTLTYTIRHASGTCRMGPEENPTSVVNPRLQVIGVQNLRVADASIMPVIPTAHTNAPTMMVAEKAADIIKEDHGYSTDYST